MIAGKNAISFDHCIFHHVVSRAGLVKSGQTGPQKRALLEPGNKSQRFLNLVAGAGFEPATFGL